MWQILLAAAVAGSGIYAKRLLNNNGGEPISAASKQSHEKCEEPKDEQLSADKSSLPQISSPPSDLYDDKTEILSSRLNDESIFRFSSASGSRIGSSNLRKKSGYYGSRGNVEKKRGVVNSVAKLGEDHDLRKSGKRFAVCLKKRRTSRNSSASKDSPSFGWGLGVGIMYMMSAGKAEISRLNTVMDETAKVVQELKTEIAKRKSYHMHTNSTPLVIPKSNYENHDEVECPSSVLTEEPQLEEPEMDQLEAELESEFQKLPLCTGEIGTSYNLKTEEIHEQYIEVKPTELDQKLCHLLIEQQEGQIVELESELKRTNSKLDEKEAQLQALKDCVRRLTDVSLATASDEETEAQVEEKIGTNESKKSMVGMKRTMDFESYG